MIRLLVVLFISSLLTACGGGGGGGNKNTNQSSSSSQEKPFTFDVGESRLTIDESSTASINLTSTNETGAVYQISSNSDHVSAVKVGGVVNFKTLEVDSDIDAEVTISGLKNGQSINKVISIKIVNNSVKILLKKIDSLIDHKMSVASMKSESDVLDFVNKVLYMSGIKTNAEIQQTNLEFQSVLKKTSVEIINIIDLLSLKKQKYISNEIGENELSETLSFSLIAISNANEPINAIINNAISESKISDPIKFTGMHYVEEINNFSQWENNLNVGSRIEKKWTFSKEFEYLDLIVFANTCIAN